MSKNDIILTRAEQGVCPICRAEFRAEWKDKFKAVQYNGKTIYVCKEHHIAGKII